MGPRTLAGEDGHTSSPWPAASVDSLAASILCSVPKVLELMEENLLRQIDSNTLVWSDPTLLLKILLFLQGLHFYPQCHLMSSWRQTTGFEWTVASLEAESSRGQVQHWTRDRPIAYPCNLSGAMARMRS